MRVLAGDIGGTNARFLIADVDGAMVTPLDEAQVASADHSDLYSAVGAAFPDALASGRFAVGAAPDAACFAVAGPVSAGRAKITNLPWRLEAADLAQRLGLARVELINDFTGVGEGLPALVMEQLPELMPGEPEEGGPCAYLGAGTGLGQGWRIPCGDGAVVVASEAGHAGFAPRTATERGLLDYWQPRLGRVHKEALLSGPGIGRIAEYLRVAEGLEPGPELAAALAFGADPAAAIGAAGDDPLAEQTLSVFAGIYGALAGDAGLQVVATGGVYLAGGIAPRMVERLRGAAFREAFLDKGAMAGLAARFPVRVVAEPRVGLLGAALRAAGGAAQLPR